jgi:hypothetical protein
MEAQTLSYIFLNFSILSYIFLNIHLYRAFGSNCRILFLQCRKETFIIPMHIYTNSHNVNYEIYTRLISNLLSTLIISMFVISILTFVIYINAQISQYTLQSIPVILYSLCHEISYFK